MLGGVGRRLTNPRSHYNLIIRLTKVARVAIVSIYTQYLLHLCLLCTILIFFILCHDAKTIVFHMNGFGHDIPLEPTSHVCGLVG
jgi:hypothetical protein